MKKTYSVPQIAFQTLNATGFSGGCTYDVVTESAQFQCPIKDPDFGVEVFVQGSCIYVAGDGEYSDLCYATSVADMNVYNS